MSVFIVDENRKISLVSLNDVLSYAESVCDEEVNDLSRAKDVICNHQNPTSESYCFSFSEAIGLAFYSYDAKAVVDCYKAKTDADNEVDAIALLKQLATSDKTSDKIEFLDEVCNFDFAKIDFANFDEDDLAEFESFKRAVVEYLQAQ